MCNLVWERRLGRESPTPKPSARLPGSEGYQTKPPRKASRDFQPTISVRAKNARESECAPNEGT